jgi:hypothetical protein
MEGVYDDIYTFMERDLINAVVFNSVILEIDTPAIANRVLMRVCYSFSFCLSIHVLTNLWYGCYRELIIMIPQQNSPFHKRLQLLESNFLVLSAVIKYVSLNIR